VPERIQVALLTLIVVAIALAFAIALVIGVEQALCGMSGCEGWGELVEQNYP